MTNIRRCFQPNEIVFMTHVTYKRMPVLVENSGMLHRALEIIENKSGVQIIAWVFLPDHFHLLVDVGDVDISRLMTKAKLSFSAKYRKSKGIKSGRIWQYRFWDHIIRDNNDMKHHFDYIHYNPVKHDYVRRPGDWELSSFNKYLTEGYYTEDWSVVDERAFEGSFGE